MADTSRDGWSSVGWNEDDPILQMYREENAKLADENAKLKRDLEDVSSELLSVKKQLYRLRTDLETYHALLPKRPATPVTPKEGLEAMEAMASTYCQRKTNKSPPRIVGNLSAFIPPRFRNLPPANKTPRGESGTSPRPKTPQESEVQSDGDESLFQSMKAAYERGCDEVGLGIY